jgi:7-carboxy-7-deazaguanine synthase
MSIDEIIEEVKKYNCNLVEVTGGEPLVQKESLELMKKLCDANFQVLLETSGSLPIQDVDKRVTIIMDLKTPSSRMMKKNLYSNIDHLKPQDEVKFVIGNREDYEWAKEIISEYKLTEKCKILMGVVFGELSNLDLASWILEDKLPVRFQMQLHKYIWEPEKRGV